MIILKSSVAVFISDSGECGAECANNAIIAYSEMKQSLYKIRDRVNAEIVHFYANKIQKMHHRNFNVSRTQGTDLNNSHNLL